MAVFEELEDINRRWIMAAKKRQAVRDKVKAKTKAKAVEMVTAKKSSRQKKRGRG